MVLVEIKTNQIADILGIQPASVSKKRNRLKKKIDGNSDKTLKKLLSAWI
jgi:DNA-binding CsgD family transcriptional regulator